MRNVLLFGDSLFSSISVDEKIHVESYPGCTARCCVDAIQKNDYIMNLDALLQEDAYNTVVICFGKNDLGYGMNVDTIVSDLLFLQDVCRRNKVETTVAMLLHGNCRTVTKFNEMLFEKTPDDILINDFLLSTNCFDNDGIHLSEEGRELLVQELKQYF